MLGRIGRRPSRDPQDHVAPLFLGTLGFVAVATAALVAMVIFTPRQDLANNDAAAYSRGVNQHTTYSALLRASVHMNEEVARLAESNNAMIRQNLAAARATLAHASGIQQNLDRIRPSSGTAASLNVLIAGEAARIAAINGHIKGTFQQVSASADAVRKGVRLNNAHNLAILAASRRIAHNQSVNAMLDAQVLRHVKSTECSPLIRACGGHGLAASTVRKRMQRLERGEKIRTAKPAARSRPQTGSGTAVVPPPAPAPSGLPSPPPKPSLLHLPPLLGAVETGAATSGLATGVVAMVRRRRRRHR